MFVLMKTGIQRDLNNLFIKGLKRQKVTLLVGARRVGKTELLRTIKNQFSEDVLWLNGEDVMTIRVLEERSAANYRKLLGKHNILIIDEAQYIPEIALKAKLMIDSIQPLHIILTGSSSFDLMQSMAPLTGRTITHQMHPISQSEWSRIENPIQTKENLADRLIFGSYPELFILESNQEKEIYLNELVNTYLLKDILAFESIRNARILRDLLVLLAYQISSEVSTQELGRQLGISKNTVERYLDLFHKAYIIFSLNGYSNNLRKEVSKTKKYYFYDNGIRNSLISDFSPLAKRMDVGNLWEHYIVQERLKYKSYRQEVFQHHFWRTYDQQEIDLIELQNKELKAFEIKWKEQSVKIPGAFSKAYLNAEFHVIHPGNYLPFIVDE